MMFKIAFRNIFRDARRSLTTMLTIAIGAAAILVFGAYVLYTTYGLQTATVERTGHLTIYRAGYFNFGSGNPALWGISGADRLISDIRADPDLKPLIAVATPIQTLAGIASSAENEASRTFLGSGFIPSDRDAMREWNEYGTGSSALQHSGLKDDDPSNGVIGAGLARILGLCERMAMSDCPPRPKAAPDADDASAKELAALPRQDFSALSAADKTTAAADAPPAIDLLAATAGGAPNVVTLVVKRVDNQGVKELDDAYVGMHLALAQQLVYGRGEHKVTGIVIQLRRTEDMGRARIALAALFKRRGLELDIRDFTELSPFYNQAIGLFRSIFSFISVIIGVVVLFTVSNAMGMSVVERTAEIGTSRALGVRRSGIREQFLLEGAMLGVLGASLGVIFAFLIALMVNAGGLSWTPPGQAQPVPLRLYLFGAWGFIGEVWAGLIVVAALAALFPANRAARLQIVDALRHA